MELNQQAKEVLMNDFSVGFAKAVASEPAIRSYLKFMALKQVDGDYDIFYLISKDETVDDKNTLRQLLEKYIKPELLKNIETNFLDLNIKFISPDNTLENWDVKSFAPIVVVRSFDEKTPTLNAYDDQGKMTTISAHDAPKDLTIVVEQSERIHIKSYETLVEDWNASARRFMPYTVEGDPVDSEVQMRAKEKGAPTPATTQDIIIRRGDPTWWTTESCPRSSAQGLIANRNVLQQILVSKSAFEYASDNWTEGRLDIVAELLTVRGDSKALDKVELYTQLYQSRWVGGTPREGGRVVFGYDTWTTFGFDAPNTFAGGIMGEWDRTLQGNTWSLSFREIDPGGTTYEIVKSVTSTFEAGIKTTDASKSVIGFNANYKGSEEGKLTIRYSDVDEGLGNQLINYCHKVGRTQLYSTGSVQFYLTLIQ